MSTSNNTAGSDSVFVTTSDPVLWVAEVAFERDRDLRAAAGRLTARALEESRAALARVAALTSAAVTGARESGVVEAVVSRTKDAVGVIAAALGGGSSGEAAGASPTPPDAAGGEGAVAAAPPAPPAAAHGGGDSRRRLSSIGDAIKAGTMKVARRVRGNTHGDPMATPDVTEHPQQQQHVAAAEGSGDAVVSAAAAAAPPPAPAA